MTQCDETIDRKGKIFVNNEDDHIKLIQNDMNGLVYIRSSQGEEMLVPSQTLCKLIRMFADMNNWK